MNRDVGSLGESEFKRLCSSVGIVANKSDQDRTGWDYIIEFPHTWMSKALDITGGAIECKIQVKSTDGSSKRRSIEMTNLMRLVKSPLPAFIVFFEFDNQEYASRVYIVHIDEQWIRKVLKKLRQFASKNKVKLNKKTLSITYNDSNLLPTVSGKALLEAVESFIRPNMETYVVKKAEIVKKVGYEKSGHRMNVVFSEDDINEINSNPSVGKFETEFEALTLYDERFDIPVVISAKKRGDGRLLMTKLEESLYQISFTITGRRFWFNARVTTLPLINTGREDLGLKVTNELFELQFNFEQNNSNFDIKIIRESTESISDLLEFHELLTLLDTGKDVLFKIHHKPSFELNFGFSKEFLSTDVLTFINITKKLSELVTFYHFPKDIKLSNNAIWQAKRGIDLLFTSFIEKSWILSSVIDMETSDFELEHAIVASFIILKVGNIGFGFLISLSGECKSTPEGLMIVGRDLYVKETSLITVDSYAEDEIATQIRRYENELNKHNNNLITIKKKLPLVIE